MQLVHGESCSGVWRVIPIQSLLSLLDSLHCGAKGQGLFGSEPAVPLGSIIIFGGNQLRHQLWSLPAVSPMRIVLSVDGGPVSLGGNTVVSDEGGQQWIEHTALGAPMPTVDVPDVLLPNRCVCED